MNIKLKWLPVSYAFLAQNYKNINLTYHNPFYLYNLLISLLIILILIILIVDAQSYTTSKAWQIAYRLRILENQIICTKKYLKQTL